MESSAASTNGISKYLDCATTTNISSGKMMTLRTVPVVNSDTSVSAATEGYTAIPLGMQDQASKSSHSLLTMQSSEQISRAVEAHPQNNGNFLANLNSVQKQIVSALNGSNGSHLVSRQLIASPSSSDTVDQRATTASEHDLEATDSDGSPVTPKRNPGSTPTSKTPTFAEETLRQPSKKRRNPRRRASTPHPIAGGSGSTGSNTTTPDSTPEKVSKAPRRRRFHKKKNDAATPGTEIGETETPAEEHTLRKRVPRRRRGPKKARNTVEPATSEEVDDRNASATKGLEVEGGDISPATELSAPPEAYTAEIQYPAFQTTEILEFAPELRQDSVQQASSTQEFPESAPADAEEDKSGNRKSQRPRRRYRYRQLRTSRPLPSKPVAELGTLSAVARLFNEFGAEFSHTRRPYLQYPKLELAARMNFLEPNFRDIRYRFKKAVKEDSKLVWSDRQVVISPIDEYFNRKDGFRGYVYDPTAEAAAEFQRLSIQAKWIEGPMEWDVSNWDASLEKFENLWSSKVARAERTRFKNACFAEFEQLLGHIFFDSVGENSNYGAKQPQPTTAETQEMPTPSQAWELADYHRFLVAFDEPPRPTIKECKEVIRENLNVNLYDLLNWFRNPDHATRPVRFSSAESLGEYSYVENKVFSLDGARVSRIAKPLLRKMAQFKFPRTLKTYRRSRATPDRKTSSAEPIEHTAAEAPVQAVKASEITPSGSTTTTAAIKGVSLFDAPTSAVQSSPAIEAPAHPPRKKRPAAVAQRAANGASVEATTEKDAGITA